MGCDDAGGPIVGGLMDAVTIKDSEFVNGSIVGADLANVTFTGAVDFDDRVIQQLATDLCPHVSNCVTLPADDVAAVFKTCSGNDHRPNAQIPTCREMEDAITAATTYRPVVQTPNETVDSDVPTVIIGTTRDKVLGRPDVYLSIGGYLIPAYAPKP